MSADTQTIPDLPGVEGSPLVSLEHFNVNIGVEWNEDLQTFWFEVNKSGRSLETTNKSCKKIAIEKAMAQ